MTVEKAGKHNVIPFNKISCAEESHVVLVLPEVATSQLHDVPNVDYTRGDASQPLSSLREEEDISATLGRGDAIQLLASLGEEEDISATLGPGSEGRSVAGGAVSDRSTGASGEMVRGAATFLGTEQHGHAKNFWKPQKRWARGKSGLYSWKYSRKY